MPPPPSAGSQQQGIVTRTLCLFVRFDVYLRSAEVRDGAPGPRLTPTFLDQSVRRIPKELGSIQ